MARVRRIDGLGLLVCVASCGGAAPKPLEPAAPCALPVRVALEASERINPNEQGVALPTSVRVYQLKQVARMEESDFAAVWETPTQALAGDLLTAQDFTLFPGVAQEAAIDLLPEARFVSAVAIYRQPTGTQWRSILPLPPSSTLCAAYAKGGAPSPAITFRFDQYRVESSTRLLADEGALDLPSDVAPTPTSGGEVAR